MPPMSGTGQPKAGRCKCEQVKKQQDKHKINGFGIVKRHGIPKVMPQVSVGRNATRETKRLVVPTTSIGGEGNSGAFEGSFFHGVEQLMVRIDNLSLVFRRHFGRVRCCSIRTVGPSLPFPHRGGCLEDSVCILSGNLHEGLLDVLYIF